MPSNPWVTVGKWTPVDIQLDLQDILPRHKIDFVNTKAITVYPDDKIIELASIVNASNMTISWLLRGRVSTSTMYQA
jgi:hypothetical protein